MNLALLLPAALGALLALAIPLLIHLARREQQRPTVFAALRWLHEHRKPRRRIRFDDWPLLLVRLLLLALLALWLARPVLTGAAQTTPWTVVVPGVSQAEARQSVEADAGELRWLAPGFPPLAGPAPNVPQSVASLLRQLDAELPSGTGLRVIVPEQISGLDGAPLRFSRDVDWQVLPGEPSPAPGDRTAPPTLVVRHAAGQENAVRILRAAVLALHEGGDATDAFAAAPVVVPLPADARRIAWLAPGALPEAVMQWIETGGEALLAAEVEFDWPGQGTWVAWRDDDGVPLVEAAASGQGRVLRFTRSLRVADMPQLLEPSFPQRLQALLDPPPAPTRARAQDVAPVRDAGLSWPEQPRELQPWLAVLVALLALLERWLAASPRRGARA